MIRATLVYAATLVVSVYGMGLVFVALRGENYREAAFRFSFLSAVIVFTLVGYFQGRRAAAREARRDRDAADKDPKVDLDTNVSRLLIDLADHAGVPLRLVVTAAVMFGIADLLVKVAELDLETADRVLEAYRAGRDFDWSGVELPDSFPLQRTKTPV